jgi:DNA (cytosine-5)-methyltransferase 1
MDAARPPLLQPDTPVVDLFCGCGGFSQGAVQAGHRVVLAVDSCPFQLAAHARNHLDATHVCASLPREDLPLPKDGHWHLHASPPCQKLSVMVPDRSQQEVDGAVDLVEWFLGLVLRAKPTTWSFEQVNSRRVRCTLDRFKRRNPGKCAWKVVNMNEFGVPQTRSRIIAGSPRLVARLLRRKVRRKACVLDFIPDPPRPFIRNNLYNRPDEKTGVLYKVPMSNQLRSVSEPCYTILALGHKRWSDEHGNTLRNLNSRENALLQTFPPDYKLPFSFYGALTGAGNAVPPLLAQKLLEA